MEVCLHGAHVHIGATVYYAIRLRTALLQHCASWHASRKPRLTPCPASGCAIVRASPASARRFDVAADAAGATKRRRVIYAIHQCVAMHLTTCAQSSTWAVAAGILIFGLTDHTIDTLCCGSGSSARMPSGAGTIGKPGVRFPGKSLPPHCADLERRRCMPAWRRTQESRPSAPTTSLALIWRVFQCICAASSCLILARAEKKGEVILLPQPSHSACCSKLFSRMKAIPLRPAGRRRNQFCAFVSEHAHLLDLLHAPLVQPLPGAAL